MLARLKKVDRKKLSQIAWDAYKSSYQYFHYPAGSAKQLLFIFGCQRSGTTLMQEIFSKDLSTKVYAEHSRLSSQDERNLRLNPLPQVQHELTKDRASLVVLKPLVETQNADKLLDFFTDSKALWMYRHYQDVAVSKLKKSGMHNGIRDMQYIVERRDSWRAENVPEEIREIILRYYAPDMNPYDGAALYWFVRNSFFFDKHLDRHPRTMICKYEDLVIEPRTHIQKIYTFLGHPLPGNNVLGSIHASSVGKGKDGFISPEIAGLCDGMLERLNIAYKNSNGSFNTHMGR